MIRQRIIVQIIRLKNISFAVNKASLRVLGDLIGGTGIIECNHAEHIIGPRATAIGQIRLDLRRHGVYIRTLHADDEMDTAGATQTGDRSQAPLQLCDIGLAAFICTSFVQGFGDFVKSNDDARPVDTALLTVSCPN